MFKLYLIIITVLVDNVLSNDNFITNRLVPDDKAIKVTVLVPSMKLT